MDSGGQQQQLGTAAMNPMMLQHSLRGLCGHDSQWVYAVFWRILPRNYPPPQWDTEGGHMDRSKGNRRNWYEVLPTCSLSLTLLRILVWEDGFCDFSACSGTENVDSRLGSMCPPGSFHRVRQDHHHGSSKDHQQFGTMNPELFFKMSHEVYNYGEGLMGKVAVDNSHKWVHQQPSLENEMGFFSPWHGNTDPHPRTWEGHFKSGIQTIAVIAVEEGVLQLGSTNKIMEDLNFVLFMQRKFNFLRSVPGVFVPHPASSRGAGPSSSKRRAGKEPASSEISASTAAYNQSLNTFTRPNADQALTTLQGMDSADQPWPHPIILPRVGRSNKRPLPQIISTSSEPTDLNTNNSWYNSYGLNNGHGFDHQISTQDQGNCDPSPPNNLPPHTDLLHSSPGHTLAPSMSSLHALLSKLPSVTAPDVHNNVNNGSAWSYPGNSSNDHGSSFEISTTSCGLSDFNSLQLPALSSDGSDLQRMVDGDQYKMPSPADYSGDGNIHVGGDLHDDLDSFDPPQNYRSMGASKEINHTRYSSMMFDCYGNLTEFGIQEAIQMENGDSFLSEICRAS